MASFHILLVDDHDKFLEMLRALLERQRDLRVVGKARNGKVAVRLARELKPDLVITDIRMPHMNGIDATRKILAQDPGAKVLCRSMHAERRYVMQALEAGALGYLVKSCPLDEHHVAIREVLAGRAYVSSGIVVDVNDVLEARRTASEESNVNFPAAAQTTVLQLLAEGQSSNDVADRLRMSIGTVHEIHRRHIVKRLAGHSFVGITNREFGARPDPSELDRDD